MQGVLAGGQDVPERADSARQPMERQEIRIVLFDLDDTLYPETQYVWSGFRAVSEAFQTVDMPSDRLSALMLHFYSVDRAHVFDLLAAFLMAGGYHSECKSSSELSKRMIECYRSHKPRIDLYPDAAECLIALKDLPVRVGIVTDGIWEVQERKVGALHLHELVDLVVYTDKLGPDRQHWKPSSMGFEVAAKYFGVPASECCYIGDNAAKDFAGPAALGMTTIWVRRPDGIYKENRPDCSGAADKAKPTYELSDLRRLPALVCARMPTA